MLTSEDVRRVTFDRIMRGYRCEDVDDYLKQVAESMDALAAEREELQKKIVVLAQRIDQYRADEDTLRTTMINAQRLGENVIKEAKQKAAEIIRSANIKSEDREQRARDEVELCKQELVTLHREADNFKKGLMKMYKEHIELITKLPSYIEEPEPEEEEPVPEEVPVEEAVPAPVPEAAPAEEYEQQQFDMQPADAPTEYYAEDPAAVDEVEFASLEEEDEEGDTLELEAIDAVPAQPAPAAPARHRSAERFAPGAGLYDAPSEEPPARPQRAKGGRRPAMDNLPSGLESFSGVDFES